MSTEIHLDAEGAARWNLMGRRLAECRQKIARLTLELEAAKADAWELEQLGKAFCEQYAPHLLESSPDDSTGEPTK